MLAIPTWLIFAVVLVYLGHTSLVTMNGLTKLAFCFVLIVVIFSSVRYAVAREALRDIDMKSIYREINRESFGGSLPDVLVSWADLPDQGQTHGAYTDGSFSIEIDQTNITKADVTAALRHEACHVATMSQLNIEDPHGPMFERCMMRFR